MSRYIEINSTYRDRNLWPFSGEFEIPIEQTGTKGKNNALDPVALSSPLFAWQGNNLWSGVPSYEISGVIQDAIGITDNIQYSSDGTTFIITTVSKPQDYIDYFRSLTINDSTANEIVRIVYSQSFGLNSLGQYRTLITVNTPITGSILSDTITITDPSDFNTGGDYLLFVPAGRVQQDAYLNYYIYNETLNEYAAITSYDSNISIIRFASKAGWATTNNFNIRKELPIIPSVGNLSQPLVNSASTRTNIIVTVNYNELSVISNNYRNYFIRLVPSTYNYVLTSPYNEIRRIISYSVNTTTNTYIFEVYPSFSAIPVGGTKIEILDFSYDNYNPFSYNGSLVSQQDMVCYEFELVDLVLPNAILTTGFGSKISFYPFVYVQLSNISSAGAGVKNVLYSNNPNSTNMIFRVPIIDIQDPFTTPFVRLTGNGVVQTIKFKPNDNLLFSVRLPNGNIYDTILEEYYSPFAPNFFAQISALFRIKKIE